MTKKITTIAIDGPAASGKGTLARGLAAALGYAFMDTGALYRAVALQIIEGGLDPDAPDQAAMAAGMLARAENLTTILASPALRTDDVGAVASRIAAHAGVRAALIDLQRNFAKGLGHSQSGAILDGRDIGTVICPDADVKLFITARDEIRAERRRKELQSRGIIATYEAVLQDLRERDARDRQRECAPLLRAMDAIVIDTSDMDASSALDMALDIIKRELAG